MTSRLLRYAVGSACAYEAVACFTGWFPTISEKASEGRKGDVLGGVVIGGLALHFLACP